MVVKTTSSPVLTDASTLDEALSSLEDNIPITTQGDCTERTIYEILLRSASECDSIENTCKGLEDAPCGNDIRYHLEKFSDMGILEHQLNQAFQTRLPPRIRKGKQKVAIDLTLLPYYGTPSEEEAPYIYRSQAKDGTCQFYAYATIYVVCKNKRVTLAIKSVKKEDTLVCIITYLIDQISDLIFDISRLYLDRGFFCVPVIRWLKALDIPFVIPVIIRGKQGGTRQLINTKRTHKTTYTLKSQKYGQCTFEAWVVGTYTKGKYGQHKLQFFAYAVYKVPIKLRGIHHDYRKRFGIETSYRLKNLCRIKTTTKNPVVRLLYIGIAFLIVDLWVFILWKYISKPRKGGRLIYKKLFTLKRMLAFLKQAIDKKYLNINAIYLPDG